LTTSLLSQTEVLVVIRREGFAKAPPFHRGAVCGMIESSSHRLEPPAM
jgi:hypothetical protein